jgi:hypothetical protein
MPFAISGSGWFQNYCRCDSWRKGKITSMIFEMMYERSKAMSLYVGLNDHLGILACDA